LTLCVDAPAADAEPDLAEAEVLQPLDAASDLAAGSIESVDEND
jgi:hypothetical protein